MPSHELFQGELARGGDIAVTAGVAASLVVLGVADGCHCRLLDVQLPAFRTFLESRQQFEQGQLVAES